MTVVERERPTDAAGARTSGGGPALLRRLREAPRPSRKAMVAALVSLVAYAVVRHFVGTSMIDMLVYQAEGRAVVHGTDLYAIRVSEWALPATYPPFAAMLFVPTSWVGVGLLRMLITGGNVILLGVMAWLSCRLVGWPRRELRPTAVVLATGLGVWLEPVWTTLRYGQVNLALACLVLWDLTRSDAHRGKGVGIGIAAAIKLTPGLFAVYLLLTGRVRAAFTAFGAFLACTALGWIAMPGASHGFWTTYVFDSSRVGRTEIVDNQSLRGAVARLLHTTDPGVAGLLVGVAAAVLGLAVAVRAGRSASWLPRAEAWGVVCTAITGLLVSPISWTHHWVWCVPLLLLLAAEAAQERSRPQAVRRRRWRTIAAATAFGFCCYGMWLVPHKGPRDQHLPDWQLAPAAVYSLLGIAVLGVAALRIRNRRAAGGTAGTVPAQRPGGRRQAPAAR
ncbi:glycosyltransferase 87 family protein [Streptacidiphilus griseoplanus]|uniref:glycosyltransferase 87 family protein n=1 Tax=Peterkaempfera griseoplana TaxID=66896 RepID=UPI001FE0DF48|nr:glycosyltransferase 87 family protein [Peterkaempfera griseoplana]